MSLKYDFTVSYGWLQVKFRLTLTTDMTNTIRPKPFNTGIFNYMSHFLTTCLHLHVLIFLSFTLADNKPNTNDKMFYKETGGRTHTFKLKSVTIKADTRYIHPE